MKAYLKKALRESFNGVISFDKELKDYTTFKIGGLPRVWVEPDSLEDLRQALAIFSKIGLRPFLIGNGSNLLVYDGRLNRAVIRLSAPSFKKVELDNTSVICGGGYSLTGLIKKCTKKGLSGLERLAGIPGTVGGAIMVNAGVSGNFNIGDVVSWVKVMDYNGKKISCLKKDRLKFKYRDSGLSRYIILEARLRLRKCDSKIIKNIYNSFLQKKYASQEYRLPNAGCIFKNPTNSRLTSGEVLDRCGLKGLRINNAQVSTKHANFIINRGKAQFRDVMSLIKLEQDIVKKKFGLWLEPEIKIIR